jgi:arylsulfatase
MGSGAATLACNNASGVGRAGTETLKVDGNVVSTQKARCPWTPWSRSARPPARPLTTKITEIPFKFNGELDKITIKLEPLQLIA